MKIRMKTYDELKEVRRYRDYEHDGWMSFYVNDTSVFAFGVNSQSYPVEILGEILDVNKSDDGDWYWIKSGKHCGLRIEFEHCHNDKEVVLPEDLFKI